MTQVQTQIVDREARDWFKAQGQDLPDINFKVVIMTPDHAKQLLGGNTNNRRLRVEDDPVMAPPGEFE